MKKIILIILIMVISLITYACERTSVPERQLPGCCLEVDSIWSIDGVWELDSLSLEIGPEEINKG